MDYSEIEKFYYTAIFNFIAPYIHTKNAYFHFNFMQGHELAALLRNKLGIKIILTVHYMDWVFDLLGDKKKLIKIIQNQDNYHEASIKLRFEKEKKFIQENGDYIIAIAQHSQKTLETLYEIPKSRLFFIPNALEDFLIKYTTIQKRELRKKYGFKSSDKLILFVGRLEMEKGVRELIIAFLQACKKISNLHLIIAGNGDYNKYFDIITPEWSKITFTGFIEKSNLSELYTISNIGIVPSIHEEFGYVALEMMMHELPTIVSNTTGLKEISNNGKYAYTVDIDNEENRTEKLKNAICYFFENKKIKLKYKQQGRLIYNKEYNFIKFKSRIKYLYKMITNIE